MSTIVISKVAGNENVDGADLSFDVLLS